MVFNLASSILVYQDFSANSTNTYVTYTEYALSITEIAFVCIAFFALFTVKKTIVSLFLLTVQIYNIVYSAKIIQFYEQHVLVNNELNNMSIAIIVLNTLNLVGFWGSHRMTEEK